VDLIVLDFVSRKTSNRQSRDFMKGPYRKSAALKSFGPGKRFTGSPAVTPIELLGVIVREKPRFQAPLKKPGLAK
jgi:hypothetical protein